MEFASCLMYPLHIPQLCGLLQPVHWCDGVCALCGREAPAAQGGGMGRWGGAVLLTPKREAKIGDVGLARLVMNDYLSAQAAIGSFSWTVGCPAPSTLLLPRKAVIPEQL